MSFPELNNYLIGGLYDLDDERRSSKPWLNQNDGKDVSEGMIILDSFPDCQGLYPVCLYLGPTGKRHGAMLCMSEQRHVWRCQCGAGAIFRKGE